MKTKITLVAALAFFGFFSLQCKKKNNLDELGLPKATQNGANVLACRFNGENWISSAGLYKPFRVYYSNDTLYIEASRKAEKIPTTSYSIALQINKLTASGDYIFDNENQFALTSSTNCSNQSDMDAKSNHGIISITKLDHMKKIISGTFSFEIPTDKCGTLKVTDGRFDVRYY